MEVLRLLHAALGHGRLQVHHREIRRLELRSERPERGLRIVEQGQGAVDEMNVAGKREGELRGRRRRRRR
jgi:hypothetical protein